MFYIKVISLLFIKKKQLKHFLIGCLFHFAQAVWRQVQSKGLTRKYNEDESFRLTVKKLIALSFVPLDQVIPGFDLICDQFDDDADDLLDYFEKTWIGEKGRRGNFFSPFLRNFKYTLLSKELVERSPNLIINYGMFMIVSSLRYLDPTIRWKVGTTHSLVASQLVIQIL